MADKKNWIAGATKNKGALHKDLAAKSTDSSKVKAEKSLAKTLKGFKK
jgi:hypothetical protein